MNSKFTEYNAQVNSRWAHLKSRLDHPPGKIELVIVIILLLAVFSLVAEVVTHTWGIGFDYQRTFYDVGRLALAGKSPYSNPTFLNPVWLAGLLAPLALLPIDVAWRIHVVLSLSCFSLALYRMKATPLATFLIMLSPLVWHNIFFGNIDWLVVLGATLPPALGVWLVALKPQIGIVVLCLWAWRDLTARKYRQLLLEFAPLLLALGFSFLLGLWPYPDMDDLRFWGAEIWPWGIPAGVWLAYLAFKKDDVSLALASAPFLSPYLAIFSWGNIILPVTRSTRWTLVGVISLWIALYLRKMLAGS